MVRHKTRWLLVRVEFESDVNVGARDGGARKTLRQDAFGLSITRKDFAQCIRDSLSSSFGVAASGVGSEIQVRLYDEASGLTMIRVPRDACGLVRTSLTFLTSIQGRSIVASVVSVNGSARIAKRAALLETRRCFRQQFFSDPTSKERVRELGKLFDAIRKVD